jgi:hypothetical protein
MTNIEKQIQNTLTRAVCSPQRRASRFDDDDSVLFRPFSCAVLQIKIPGIGVAPHTRSHVRAHSLALSFPLS